MTAKDATLDPSTDPWAESENAYLELSLQATPAQRLRRLQELMEFAERARNAKIVPPETSDPR